MPDPRWITQFGRRVFGDYHLRRAHGWTTERLNAEIHGKGVWAVHDRLYPDCVGIAAESSHD